MREEARTASPSTDGAAAGREGARWHPGQRRRHRYGRREEDRSAAALGDVAGTGRAAADAARWARGAEPPAGPPGRPRRRPVHGVRGASPEEAGCPAGRDGGAGGGCGRAGSDARRRSRSGDHGHREDRPNQPGRSDGDARRATREAVHRQGEGPDDPRSGEGRRSRSGNLSRVTRHLGPARTVNSLGARLNASPPASTRRVGPGRFVPGTGDQIESVTTCNGPPYGVQKEGAVMTRGMREMALAGLLVGAVAFVGSGCGSRDETKGPAEQLGKKVDDASQATKNAATDAAKATGNAAAAAAGAAKDAAHTTADAAKDAAAGAANVAKDAAVTAKDAAATAAEKTKDAAANAGAAAKDAAANAGAAAKDTAANAGDAAKDAAAAAADKAGDAAQGAAKTMHDAADAARNP